MSLMFISVLGAPLLCWGQNGWMCILHHGICKYFRVNSSRILKLVLTEWSGKKGRELPLSEMNIWSQASFSSFKLNVGNACYNPKQS